MKNKYKETMDIETVLRKTLAYSRERNYVGWDKHDGMSSRIRRRLPFEHKLLNLVFQETIKRAPINLRPVFLVEQRPSPKGLSLFTMSNLNAYYTLGSNQYLSEAEALCERIVSHNLSDIDGFCLSHNHQLQGLSSKKPIATPNIVSTSYGVKALMNAAEINEEYAELAYKSIDFIRSELHKECGENQTKISYTPISKSNSYTLNANALAARLFVDLYDYSDEEQCRRTAEKILSYVADCQDDIGGWKYTDPPSASHLSMDNYHNGFILESFLRYRDVINKDAYTKTTENALNFYRNTLYNNNGAPCWDETSKYPRDIHAAAQGIVTFSLAGDLEFAKKIIDWTFDNLYAGEGQFYYQKKKYYTKKFTLMRWCQAWMAYALSTYLKTIHSD